MNTKEFRQRWMRSKIEPALFYMPVNTMSVNKTSKLVIHCELFNALKEDLSGFDENIKISDISNIFSFIDIHFVIVDINGKTVYNFKYNSSFKPNKTDTLEIELSTGEYYIKILRLKQAKTKNKNDINQKIKIQGETHITWQFYQRIFKAVAKAGDGELLGNFKETLTPYPHFSNIKTVRLKNLCVYDLQWDNWKKFLDYDCVPHDLSTFYTSGELLIYLGGVNEATGFIKAMYIGQEDETFTIHTNLATFNYDNGNSSQYTFVREYENNIRYDGDFSAVRGFTGTYSDNQYYNRFLASSFINNESYFVVEANSKLKGNTYIQGAAPFVIERKVLNVYFDTKKGIDVNDMSTGDFFHKYGGTIYAGGKHSNQSISKGNVFVLISTQSQYDEYFAKYGYNYDFGTVNKYLPKINFIDDEYVKEIEKSETQGNIWGGKTLVKNTPEFTSYNIQIGTKIYKGGATVYNNFDSVSICGIGEYWYADNYNDYA